jgi:hypothetical protein
MRVPWLAAALVALSCRLSAQPPAMSGFNFPCWTKDCYNSPQARASLSQLAQTGASWVAVTPSWYMRGVKDPVIARRELTPSDDSVRAVIRKAKADGLKVALKPHVDVESDEGRFRSSIDPADRDLEAWFKSYKNMILHYARLAAEEHADLFVVGTELAHLDGSDHRSQWADIISGVRAVYPGPLTYAANWYKFNVMSDLGIARIEKVGFWDLLDFIGVDCYVPAFGNKTTYKASWYPGYADLQSAYQRYHKQVIFTEIGISSRDGANRNPAEWADKGGVDLDVQKKYFESFLEVFGDAPWFAGFWQWDWEADPGAGGSGDKNMTVQGKPALDVLKAYFARSKSSAPPPRSALGESFTDSVQTAIEAVIASPVFP